MLQDDKILDDDRDGLGLVCFKMTISLSVQHTHLHKDTNDDDRNRLGFVCFKMTRSWMMIEIDLGSYASR